MKITETDSGDQSKGNAFGLEGDQFMVVIGGILAALIVFMACHTNDVDMALTIFATLIPMALAALHLYVFLIKKPPSYQSNLIRQWLGDDHIPTKPRKKNPYI